MPADPVTKHFHLMMTAMFGHLVCGHNCKQVQTYTLHVRKTAGSVRFQFGSKKTVGSVFFVDRL